jgi:hypothetical protein
MDLEQAIKHPLWGNNLRRLLPALGEFAVLVIVAVALLWPAPVTSNQLFAAWLNSDLIISHWPTAIVIQRTFVQSHVLPLWNPYYAGGQPLAADPLAALFYPPTQLVQIFSVRDYYLVLILGHLVFAGLGMLLLARRAFGLPRLPALVAAVSYMATPPLIAHLGAGHVTMILTVAWYPWLVLACWATVRNPMRWGALLGLCIGMILLAGHPQMAYYGLLMTVVTAAWLLIKRWRQAGRRATLASIVGLAAAGALGLLLAAIFLLPELEFQPLSTRVVFSQYLSYATPPQSFLHALIFLQPASAQTWEEVVSPGLAVLVLALLGLVTRIRMMWPVIPGMVLVGVLALGYATPLYVHIVHILPEFKYLRDLERIWFVALVPLALLAGLGTDALIRGVRRISTRAAPVTGDVAGFLAVLVLACTLVTSDSGYARVGDVNALIMSSTLARTAAQLAGSGRIYDAQRNIPQIDAVELQVPFADGFNPLMIESYVEYILRAGGYYPGGYYLYVPPRWSPPAKLDAKMLGLMNVSMVVSTKPLNDSHLVQVGEVNSTLLYRNTADAGPGYLVEPASNGSAPSLSRAQRLDVSVQANIQDTEHQTFTFTTGLVAYFVIAMPSYPGWTARVDGQPVAIERFGGALPAIKIGPGRHTISYTYTPKSVRNGALLSAAGLLAVLAWLAAAYVWKQRVVKGDHKSSEEVPSESLVHSEVGQQT